MSLKDKISDFFNPNGIKGKEREILLKYKKGLIVEEEDREWLDLLSQVGFIDFGYDFTKEQQTAKITTLGYRAL